MAALVELGYTHVKGMYIFSHNEPKVVASTFNARTNGVGEPLKDRIAKAIQLYDELCEKYKKEGNEKVPAKNAFAQKHLIPPKTFTEAYRSSKYKSVFAEITDVRRIKDNGTFDILGQIRKLDKKSAETAAQITSKLGLRKSDVEELKQEFESSATFEQKQEALKRWGEQKKNEHSNGSMSLTVRRNTGAETVFKEVLTKLANKSNSVDESKLKSLIQDPEFRKNVQKIFNMFKRVLS